MATAKKIKHFGEFELMEKLGSGSYADVYLTSHRQAPYAIKISKTADHQGQILKTFRTEAAAVQMINHPNIINIKSVDAFDHFPFVIMEYISFPTLRQMLQPFQKFDLSTYLSFATEVALALEAVHNAGIVHRDLQPTNIFWDVKNHRIKIIDFGLAVTPGAERTSTVGTIGYMSPEQSGALDRPVDYRSDLYSLGTILFELLTGSPPYKGEGGFDIIRQHLNATIPRPSTMQPDLPPYFDPIIAKLLGKDPDDRYQSAESLIQDLKQIRTDSGLPTLILSGTRNQSSEIPAHVPMVGREKELQEIRTLFQKDASTLEGGLVLVSGQPGSGKSRLAYEVFNMLMVGEGDHQHSFIHARCVKGTLLAPIRNMITALIQKLNKRAPHEKKQILADLDSILKRSKDHLDCIDPQLIQELHMDAGSFKMPSNETLPEAVSQLVVGLVQALGPVAVLLDDVQWIDEPSRDVLHLICERMADTPVVVVATSRSDEGSQEPLQRFRQILGAQIKKDLMIQNLNEDATHELTVHTLGELAVPREFSSQIFRSTDGNPFVIGEFIRNIVTEGVVAPGWEEWQVDYDQLKSLELPSNATELVQRRIAALRPQMQTTLITAAVVGTTFEADFLVEILQKSPVDIARDLVEAEQLSMLITKGPKWSFFHDRVQEAALDLVSDDEVRHIHDQIAQCLERKPSVVEGQINTLAKHYAAGHYEENPAPAFAAFIAAAYDAKHAAALESAQTYFQLAENLSKKFSFEMDSHWESCAEVYGSIGLKVQAEERLLRAFEATADPFDRARIYGKIARHNVEMMEMDKANAYLHKSFAEIQWSVPQMAKHLLVGMGHTLLGEFIYRTGFGFGSLKGERAKKIKIITDLHEKVGFAKFFDLDPLTGMIGSLRVYHLGQRLGTTTETARLFASIGVLCGALKQRKAIDELYRRGEKMALRLNDARLEAHVKSYYAVALSVYGADLEAEAMIDRIAADHRDTVSAEVFVFLCAFYASSAILRGFPELALKYSMAGIEILTSGHFKKFGEYFLPWCYDYAITALTMMGRQIESQQFRKRLSSHPHPHPEGTYHLAIHLNNVAQMYVEQGEISDVVEQDFARHRRLGLFIPTAINTTRHFYISQAYVRLNQYYAVWKAGSHTEDPASGRKNLKQRKKKLGRALFQLKLCSNNDLFRSHYYMVQGVYGLLSGQPRKAEKSFAKAEHFAIRIKNMMALFEIHKWKARWAKHQGHLGSAQEWARLAYQMCHLYKWVSRGEQISKEFELSVSPHNKSQKSTGTSTSYSRHSSSRDPDTSYATHCMSALIRISEAVSAQRALKEQASTALDEILAVLGGERAVLWMYAPAEEELKFEIGRNQDHETLDKIAGYSSTVVEKVWRDQAGLILNGSEDGLAMDAQSVVLHDLRSIVAAPIKIEDKCLGILYVDTSIAKGMFNEFELHMLNSIGLQVGIAIENARKAQMEVEKKAMERDLEVTGLVQNLLIPKQSSFSNQNYELELAYQSSHRSGGDWVWYEPLDDGRLIVLVGDVAGHGPGPAIITGLAAGAFKVAAWTNMDFKESVLAIEHAIESLANSQLHMTFTAMEFSPEQKQVRIINAGGPAIFYWNKDKNVTEQIFMPSNPMGLGIGGIVEKSVPFKTDDRLMTCTDGAFEFTSGQKPFGLRRLSKLYADTSRLPLPQALQSMTDSMQQAADQDAEDDTTLVLISARN